MAKRRRAGVKTPDQYRRLVALSDQLGELLTEQQRVYEGIHEVVGEMRENGASWVFIGQLMGTSYQTAHKRFGRGKIVKHRGHLGR